MVKLLVELVALGVGLAGVALAFSAPVAMIAGGCAVLLAVEIHS